MRIPEVVINNNNNNTIKLMSCQQQTAYDRQALIDLYIKKEQIK
jgi:hypothetical protein